MAMAPIHPPPAAHRPQARRPPPTRWTLDAHPSPSSLTPPRRADRSRAREPAPCCLGAQVAAAHAAGGDWRGALALWKDLVHQGLDLDAELYKSVYEACDAAGAHEEAKAVLEFAERRGVPLMALVGVLADGSRARGDGEEGDA